ncbi:hypothetical protein MBAV_001028 [Candidatus Magnetobacterium bavaricum]|uniref:Type IV pilus assembly PilZ domain protein n=1 Tax=Candidatus Magnetobacterium bavaricum TaxID=29290 RepID=A0A0F3H1I7_9BACT|nr:hypothetical protein MBAV_001028 [Candidatus Magnetobacterium bavaricum]
MKTVAVYPSCVISLKCPECGTIDNVTNEYPPDNDFTLQCPTCTETFLVKLNHRQFFRGTIKGLVAYSLDDIKDPFAISAKSAKAVDISRCGIRLEGKMRYYSEDYEKVGNLLTLLFNIPPNKRLLKVKAEIKRVVIIGDYKFEMGLSFINPDVYIDQAIGTFLMP